MSGKQAINYRRGASAVEFAVVAPIFILLVFGMVESGRMMMVQQLLTNAAREGARRAVLEGETEQNVKDVVTGYLGNTTVTITDQDITVTPTPETANAGEPVTVTVRVSFSDVSWLPPMFFANSDLAASTVMRREGTPAPSP